MPVPVRTRPFSRLGSSLLASLLGGCAGVIGSGDSGEQGPPLVAEVRLHQTADRSWAAARVLADPAPGSTFETGSPLDDPDPPDDRVGACALWREEACVPDCLDGARCRPSAACRPARAVAARGTIDVGGSSLLAGLQLAWSDERGDYLSDPPDGARMLFQPGDRLDLSIDVAPWTAHTGFAAPAPIVLVGMPPGGYVIAPGKPLRLAWQAEPEERVVVAILAEMREGHAREIRCVAEGQTEPGQFDVPASLLDRLGADAKRIQVLLRRERRRVVRATGLDADVVFSAASTVAAAARRGDGGQSL